MCYISVTAVLRRDRQQELEFKASLSYKAKPTHPQMEEEPDQLRVGDRG